LARLRPHQIRAFNLLSPARARHEGLLRREALLILPDRFQIRARASGPSKGSLAEGRGGGVRGEQPGKRPLPGWEKSPGGRWEGRAAFPGNLRAERAAVPCLPRGPAPPRRAPPWPGSRAQRERNGGETLEPGGPRTLPAGPRTKPFPWSPSPPPAPCAPPAAGIPSISAAFIAGVHAVLLLPPCIPAVSPSPGSTAGGFRCRFPRAAAQRMLGNQKVKKNVLSVASFEISFLGQFVEGMSQFSGS